jgi:hypothetical protein
MRSPRVIADVATDCARLLAGRVRRKEEPERLARPGQLEVYDSWLDHRAPVLDVDLEDATHPCQRHQDTSAVRDGAAGYARAGAAGDHRHSGLSGKADHRLDL